MIIKRMNATSLLATPSAPRPGGLWAARLGAALLAAAAAAGAVFWLLHAPSAGAGDPSPGLGAPSAPPLAPQTLARVLGAADAAPTAPVSAEAAPLKLLGVIAVGRAGGSQGRALLGAEGQPPKPYHVGQEVAQGWVLQEVQARQVLLRPADGGRELTLVLPPPGASTTPAAGASAANPQAPRP
jgi:general secretion pathway protein C